MPCWKILSETSFVHHCPLSDTGKWHNVGRKYGLNISYEKVRKALLKVDPGGVELRSRNVIRRRVYETKGPFHVFHIDGHDKLKKWGFALHGGIDGFSRIVLWLNVSTTNNDPLVVANYFLQCVTRYKMAPKRLRFDRGNENIYCQDIQTFLTKTEDSYRYGSSVRNQRIEALWSRLTISSSLVGRILSNYGFRWHL